MVLDQLEPTNPRTTRDDAPARSTQPPSRPIFSPRVRRNAGTALLTLVLGLLVLLPLVAIEIQALANGDEAYRSVLRDDALPSVLTSTLLLGGGSVLIAVTLGTLLAWWATLLPLRLRWMQMLPILPIMVPPLAIVTGWSFLLSPRVGYLNAGLRELPWWSDLQQGPFNVFSMLWIVVITGTLLVSFVYLFTLTALRSIDAALLESARVSGASRTRTWFRVVLPLLRPSLVYSSAIVLLLGLGQFTAPLLLGREQNIKVLTTAMYEATQKYPIDYGFAAAYGSPLIIVGAVLIIIQRRSLRSSERFQAQGGRSARPSTESSPWAVVPLVLYILFASVLPIAALVNVAFSEFYSGAITSPATATWSHFAEVFNDPSARRAITNSLTYSFLALLVVLPLSYLLASLLVSQQQSRVVRGVVDTLVNVPLVMPGVLFGAGILFAFSSGPIVLYGTGAALVIAYVTIMIPHVVRMQMAGMISAGNSMADAARVHGATPLRTHLKVMVPMLRQPLAAAAALTLSILPHEFAASAMVRSTDTEVMGTLLLRYWTTGSYPAVAVMALIMCALTALMVGLALGFGGRSALNRF